MKKQKSAAQSKLAAANEASIIAAGLAADVAQHQLDRKHVHGARAPPAVRLLDKAEVCAIAGVTFDNLGMDAQRKVSARAHRGQRRQFKICVALDRGRAMARRATGAATQGRCAGGRKLANDMVESGGTRISRNQKAAADAITRAAGGTS